MSDEMTIPQMREAIEAKDKEIRTLREQNGSLSTENRTLQAREVFREAGYAPNYADLFVSKIPEGDITQESVAEFAQAYSLPALEAAGEGESGFEGTGEEGTQQGEAPGSGLASMSGGGSRPGEGGQGGAQRQSMSRQEWEKLNRENPAAAREAVANGRVQLREDNPYVAQNAGVGRENPWAPRLSEE